MSKQMGLGDPETNKCKGKGNKAMTNPVLNETTALTKVTVVWSQRRQR